MSVSHKGFLAEGEASEASGALRSCPRGDSWPRTYARKARNALASFSVTHTDFTAGKAPLVFLGKQDPNNQGGMKVPA